MRAVIIYSLANRQDTQRQDAIIVELNNPTRTMTYLDIVQHAPALVKHENVRATIPKNDLTILQVIPLYDNVTQGE